MANFKLIGLYKISPTLESIVLAAQFHGYDWLIGSNGEYPEEINWSMFKNLCLLEFQVTGKYSPTELLEIKQGSQVPYLELYLDSTGVKHLNELDAIKSDECRVCFFMHFIDLSEPLQVKDQLIDLPPLALLPSRLEPFTHYVPVD